MAGLEERTAPRQRAVLVTGGSGFAGRHLIARLSRSRASIRAWTLRTPPPPSPTGAAGGVEWRQVDLLSQDEVRRALDAGPPDEVYHLAGAAHAGSSWQTPTIPLAVNVIGTAHLLEALGALSTPVRVVVSGSGMVYAPSDAALTEASPLGPRSPYAISKLAQERLCLAAVADDGLAVVVARSFNHIGPGQEPTFFASSFARQLALIECGRLEPVLRVGNLDARRDLTDVRDTVRAYEALMRDGVAGRVYNVCRGEAVAVRDVLDRLVALARVRVDVEVDPVRLRPDDVPLIVGSPALVEREAGWTPGIPLDDTLADLLDDWRRLVRSEPATIDGA
jgi:GDP-4-dehydro-6-deoxy-D-mannose reductase